MKRDWKAVDPAVEARLATLWQTDHLSVRLARWSITDNARLAIIYTRKGKKRARHR